MHRSAMLRMKWFIDNYIPKNRNVKILDVGSYNVNGCYKDLFKEHCIEYTGLDISAGPNVDVVVKNPYEWRELKDGYFDFIISGNAFEHIEYPWLTMSQIYRKLKADGIICILAPFNLSEHRYPVDCYRYYPDGLRALATWAGFTVIDATVGGVPTDYDENEWRYENYDDSVLIAIKSKEVDFNVFPKFDRQIRSNTICPGG